MQYCCTLAKIIDTEVLVIGGGPAGFGAAVASARNGAKTILAERFGTLGGMATTGLVGPFMCSFDYDGEEQLSKGLFEELCVRTVEKGGAIHPSETKAYSTHTSYYREAHNNVTPYLSPVLARVMDEMAMESGVTLLFNTQFVDAVCDGERIDTAVFANKDGLIGIRPKVCIDCTGDADVAVRAGVETWYGNRNMEDSAQPTTLFFEVGNVDREALMKEINAHLDEIPGATYHNLFHWLVEKARENGDWTLLRGDVGLYESCIPGRFKVNTTRINKVDATRPEDVSRALVEGRRQVEELMNFFHKYVPGMEHAQLLAVADALGVRETRHIVGRYELTEQDVLHRAEFEDSIMSYGYSIDLHSPTDGGGFMGYIDKYYNIPYRSLVPLGCDNLLVAGRCICGTSAAAGSFRCMSSCVTMGQAAGTAAALNKDKEGAIGDIDVKQLQKTLLQQGAVIKGIAL